MKTGLPKELLYSKFPFRYNDDERSTIEQFADGYIASSRQFMTIGNRLYFHLTAKKFLMFWRIPYNDGARKRFLLIRPYYLDNIDRFHPLVANHFSIRINNELPDRYTMGEITGGLLVKFMQSIRWGGRCLQKFATEPIYCLLKQYHCNKYMIQFFESLHDWCMRKSVPKALPSELIKNALEDSEIYNQCYLFDRLSLADNTIGINYDCFIDILDHLLLCPHASFSDDALYDLRASMLCFLHFHYYKRLIEDSIFEPRVWREYRLARRLSQLIVVDYIPDTEKYSEFRNALMILKLQESL